MSLLDAMERAKDGRNISKRGSDGSSLKESGHEPDTGKVECWCVKSEFIDATRRDQPRSMGSSKLSLLPPS
jgi:hypothetical protein